MNADKTAYWSYLSGGRAAPEGGRRPIVVSSQLDVEGGVGRVAAGGASTATSAGRQLIQIDVLTGTNVVEAVLESASGRPGMWRFDLGGSPGLKHGSLRVVAGTVALITDDTLAFRLEGKPGERVVFTFEAED